MINLQRSFEQSLRTTSPYPPLLHPMRSEIHKGCTGKAHGCGTPKNQATTNHGGGRRTSSQSFRKNSFSSETVSDCSSEFSSPNSVSDSTTTTTTTTTNGRGSRSLSKGVQSQSPQIPPVDRRLSRTPSVRRHRLLSDGSRGEGETIDDNLSGTGKQSPLVRGALTSRSFRLPNTNNNNSSESGQNGTKPPWQHVYSAKLDHLQNSQRIATASAAAATGVSRTGSFNSRLLRNSIRKKNNVVYWHDINEQALRQKPHGGTYKLFAGINNLGAAASPDKVIL